MKAQQAASGWKRQLKNEFSAIAFLAPFLIPLLVFYIWPLLRGAYISLHSWTILGMEKYVGFNNYTKILTNSDFYKYLWNSLYFVILVVPIIISLGLLLALLIHRKIPFQTMFRSIYFLPYVLSVSVISFIWLRMFDSKHGLVNVILETLGLSSVHWLTSPNAAWWSIVIATVWWTVGFVMVLFLAGLQEISQELYEAADIDGASSFHKFRFITLPGLSSVMKVQIFFQIIAGLKLFGQVQIMTNGGPGDTTNTIIRYIYVTGFKKDMFGLAAAQSTLFCIFMLLIAAVQYMVVNRKES
ncbi:sugar ABC transporter permease [Paenibacillus sp. FSL W8-0186]|uniref:Sugar ABC transporter permease n=1 Tax=Paenibacillus woosongensis TaxID=307580 RepID=A0ABQ4MN07_9BACL|nr:MULTISPECIES: sugar ABC transporter permease [Paenibacillus]GIP57391.1 sugar ABC transporter permease [Paenibacillus woosongensis]